MLYIAIKDFIVVKQMFLSFFLLSFHGAEYLGFKGLSSINVADYLL